MVEQVVTQMVVVPQSAMRSGQHHRKVALFNPDGSVLTVVQLTAETEITDYVIAGAGAALAETDTINEALGKLEKRVADLEAA